MQTLLRAPFFCLVLAAATSFAAEKPTFVLGDSFTPNAAGTATANVTLSANGAPTTVFASYGRKKASEQTSVFAAVKADAANKLVPLSLTGLIGGETYKVIVEASNSAGTVKSGEKTFVASAFTPALAVTTATKVAGGKATLNGLVTANGTPGSAHFEYGPNETNGTFSLMPLLTPDVPLDGKQIAFAFSAAVESLERAKTYQFRLVFVNGATVTKSTALSFLTNNSPVATDDTFNLTTLTATIFDVLKNDKDADAPADELQVSALGNPSHGTVVVSSGGTRIRYTPKASFTGFDSFTYTVTDGFAGSLDTATVSILAPGLSVAGTHGGLLKDADGKEIGYFQIMAQKSGSFTGTILVDGERRAFSGTLSADGQYVGSVSVDGAQISVKITATVGATETTIAADFGDGFWTAETVARPSGATERADRAGRYTVEFAGGTSTGAAAIDGSQPDGSGWAAVKLLEDGMARIKGRLADGRSFATSGLLGFEDGKTVVTFFDDPRDTRVAGTIILGTAVTGTLHAVREPSGRGDFAAGYDITSTATGAKYVPPKDGQRAIEAGSDAKGRLLNVAISGGGLAKTISIDVRLTDNDKVRVLNPGPEDLSLKFDRKSGRFTVKATGDTEDQRIKGTGVLIQTATGLARGSGVFNASGLPGKVTITPGSGTGTPAPRPTPTPAPSTPPPQVVIQ